MPRIGHLAQNLRHYHHVKPGPSFIAARSVFYSSSSTPRISRGGYRLRTLFVLGLSIGIGATIGAEYRSAVVHAKDERRRKVEYKDTLEFQYLDSHPIIQKFRADPEFEESWYFSDLPATHRDQALTSGLLTGEGKISIEPLKFQSKDKKRLYIFYHVGDRVQGHDNIVHGGFLATLIDEGLVWCAFPSLPRRYGATANLELNYRQPSFINTYMMLECIVTEVKGRKAWVQGAMYNLNDSDVGSKPLVEATALVVEPRWAKYVSWLF